jgi:hypothetical protein
MEQWIDLAVEGVDPPNTHELPACFTDAFTIDLLTQSFEIKLNETYRQINPIVSHEGPVRPDDTRFHKQRNEKEHQVSQLKDLLFESKGLTDF